MSRTNSESALPSGGAWQDDSGRCPLFVPEANAQAAGGSEQRLVRRQILPRLERGCQRHIQHTAVSPGDHAIDPALGDQVHGIHAESGGYEPVVPGRLAASLNS